MRTITRIFLGLGGLLFIVDGVLKLYNPEFVVPVVNQTLPCGLALLIVGAGNLPARQEK